MAGALAAPTTFTPAFSTTTASPVTVVEGFSDLGLALDNYEGASDIADSDELIALTLGGNFVSGVRLDPAGDLVAQAKRFAEELSNAGRFLAVVGLGAAEGATGAGAGAGFALAAARSAVALSGDGLFANGARDTGDADEQSGQLHGGTTTNQVPQTPAERLVALRADIVRLVAEGEKLEGEGDQIGAQTRFNDAAQVYQEIATTGGMLTKEGEMEQVLAAAADLFERGGDKDSAQSMRSALEAWNRRPQQVSESPETVRAGAVGQTGAILPHMLQVNETKNWKVWLTEPSNPYRERIDILGLAVVENYVEDIVAEYFEKYFKERTGPVSDRVPKEWFIWAFENRLTDATGKRTSDSIHPAAGGRLAVFRGTVIDGLVSKGEELESGGQSEDAKVMFAAAALLYYGILARAAFDEGWLAKSEVVELLKSGLELAKRAGDNYLAGVMKEGLEKSK